jgi:hypothetical protein
VWAKQKRPPDYSKGRQTSATHACAVKLHLKYWQVHPTTIFTSGILLWTRSTLPKILLVIPLLWSIIGFSAAVSLGIREDIGLLVAGVAGTTMIVIRDKPRGTAEVEAGHGA